MTILDRARSYLGRMPPAVSGQGGHDQTFRTACVLVQGFGLSPAEARPLMVDYSARCQPPWTDANIDHKLADAERVVEPKGKGYLLKGFKHRYEGRQSPQDAPGSTGTAPGYQDAPRPAHTLPPAKYEISDTTEIPAPIPDGTRELLLAAFSQGEGVRIAIGKFNEAGHEVPKDAGVVFSREEWLAKLDLADGATNKLLRSVDRNGIFISVNPMKVGGSTDADATAFRHCLLEFDSISLVEQWSIILQSKIPATAVLYSGGKSLHAWVKIDAKDRREFDERVAALYHHFEAYKPDVKNRNPSRFSRLPNCERGSARQELLAVRIGAESFSAWTISQEVDDIGTEVDVARMRAFNPASDPNEILGKRWLCRGASCLIVGQSGLGKSSLAMQMAILWALGRPSFGICPARPLRSVMIQAENDEGDMSEMFQGVWQGMGLPESLGAPEHSQVSGNLTTRHLHDKSGPGFLHALRRIIDRHKPDLVWIDPILAFVGDDISKQTVIASFFRVGMNAIAKATGVIFMIMHHTTKPPREAKAKTGWTASDWQYEGAGSSDFTNAVRAVLVLKRQDKKVFELMMAKRGERANARDLQNVRTTSIWLKHGDHGICWHQIGEPTAEEKAPPKDRKAPAARAAAFDFEGFIASIAHEHFSATQLTERAQNFGGIGHRVAWSVVLPELKRRMFFDPDTKTFSTKT